MLRQIDASVKPLPGALSLEPRYKVYAL